MKRSIKGIIILFIIIAAIGTGCKKFLNVQSVSALSGNAFFKTASDYEAYMSGIYNQFRSYTMYNTQFFPATGDFRCAPMTAQDYNRQYINYLSNNDLMSCINDYYWGSGKNGGEGDMYVGLTDWASFFQIIASCNILIDASQSSGSILSEAQKSQYLGEATFMRNLCYFFMARLYGDIPYYTDAYHSAPLTRQDMVSVLHQCMTDMSSVMNDMPWTYSDPSKVGVRATRGSALALMMHMNMWCAGFDPANDQQYWQATDSLGNILLTQNGGVYQLLPFNQFHAVFEGGSSEGLFEIEQSLNKNELFQLFATFTDNVLHSPHKQNGSSTSYAIFAASYLKQLYPAGIHDDRKPQTLTADPQGSWFDQTDPTNNYTQEFLKYTNIYAAQGEDVNPDDNQIVFRLPDAILLRAEACADLGKNDDAIQLLDIIRERAGAPDYKDGETQSKNLSEAIYFERCKELMGEGWYFYDLVRTGKILDPNYCIHPMTRSAFDAGAWTWPLSQNVRTENPGITLNTYWAQ